MIRYAKLPFTFDPVALQADLGRIEAEAWAPHFNTRYYTGDWSGISLRSVGGVERQLFSDPSRPDEFADTPRLMACPAIQAVMAAFACPLEGVRLLRLRAGSRIREHRDYGLCLEKGEFRVHVPVVTNPLVDFTLGGERLTLRAGECWYLNFDLPHAVANAGTVDRVHLVLDGRVNPWIEHLIALAAGARNAGSSPKSS
jgi:hypothetical protein